AGRLLASPSDLLQDQDRIRHTLLSQALRRIEARHRLDAAGVHQALHLGAERRLCDNGNAHRILPVSREGVDRGAHGLRAARRGLLQRESEQHPHERGGEQRDEDDRDRDPEHARNARPGAAPAVRGRASRREEPHSTATSAIRMRKRPDSLLSAGSSGIHSATLSVSTGSSGSRSTSPSATDSPVASTSPREPSSFTARSSIVPPLFRAVLTVTSFSSDCSERVSVRPSPSFSPPKSGLP